MSGTNDQEIEVMPEEGSADPSAAEFTEGADEGATPTEAADAAESAEGLIAESAKGEEGVGDGAVVEEGGAEVEIARHKEAMLRMQAEMENLRKRLIRDLERSRRFALERMMKDLLQVRDSLERGLELNDDSVTVEALREGKALTLKMLGKVMEDHGLEIIDPSGEKFDPQWHEAMTMRPSEEFDENTVVEVLQKGFKLHDRLVRPAMVIVSSKP